MDKDTTLLCRVSTNHLFLSQFEAFRATILSLKRRKPELALSILQSVVANGGKFDNVVYSPNCSSPALLTWLCSTELLQFDKPTSVWSIDPDALKLRVEFLLYVQMIISRVSNGVCTIVDSIGSGGPDAHDEFRDSEKELNCIMRVLDELMELGFRRLKEDLVVVDESKGGEDPADVGGVRVGEEELECLRHVILQYMDVFDALCLTIQKQVGEVEHEDSGLAITLRKIGGAVSEEEDLKLLKMIQKKVQLAHLDAMKLAVNGDDLEGAALHIRYLHLDYGLAKEDYRVVFQDFLKKVLSVMEGYGNDWLHTREKLLLIYQEALSSNCIDLIQMIQAVQDELLVKEIEVFRMSDNKKLPLLQKFQDYIKNLQLHGETNDNSISLNSAISSCQRELYHYARVAGLHVLDCVIDAALSDVEKDDLEEACNILSLFPRLRPLVAIMGWDLLRGKTPA